MANFQINNDQIVVIPLIAQNAEGISVPLPPGSFTAASSSPLSVAASIDVLTLPVPGLRVVPLVQNAAGVTITVTGPGMSTFQLVVDIVPNVVPSALSLNLPAAVKLPQPVPTTVGTGT